MVLLASACTIEVDEPVEPVEPVEPEVAVPALVNENEPSSSMPVDSNIQPPNPGLNPEPGPVTDSDSTLNPTAASTPDSIPDSSPVQTVGPQLDQSGIATSEAALMDLLLTDHNIENDGQVTPTSVWICTDVFEDIRNYFFYDAGVINSVRPMVIERTLSQTDNTFVDIRFFWSVTSVDSILLSSLMPGEGDNLVTSGQQWDVTTIRFSELESRPAFTAQSVLRGNLSCAAFAI